QPHVEPRLGGGGAGGGLEAAPERVGAGAAEVGGEAAARAAEAAEERLEEVGEVGELLGGDGAEGGAARCERRHVAGGAVLVVHAPLLGVGEDGVRLVDLLEALLGPGVVGVTVGVVLGGQLAEGAPDLVLGRALWYPQDL